MTEANELQMSTNIQSGAWKKKARKDKTNRNHLHDIVCLSKNF